MTESFSRDLSFDKTTISGVVSELSSDILERNCQQKKRPVEGVTTFDGIPLNPLIIIIRF